MTPEVCWRVPSIMIELSALPASLMVIYTTQLPVSGPLALQVCKGFVSKGECTAAAAARVNRARNRCEHLQHCCRPARQSH